MTDTDPRPPSDETAARLERIRASQAGVVQPDETILFLLTEVERWRGHHRHTAGVLRRYAKAVRLYWDACRREQAVADGDMDGPSWAEAQHAAHVAREKAEDGLWEAAGLPSPWEDADEHD